MNLKGKFKVEVWSWCLKLKSSNASNNRLNVCESVEELEENIVKIGRSVRIKLNESVFRESFMDLKKQDYLRESTPDWV